MADARQLISQPETIPSCYRRSRQTKFLPHPVRYLEWFHQASKFAKTRSRTLVAVLARDASFFVLAHMAIRALAAVFFSRNCANKSVTVCRDISSRDCLFFFYGQVGVPDAYDLEYQQ
jgi:hypothetical protein